VYCGTGTRTGSIGGFRSWGDGADLTEGRIFLWGLALFVLWLFVGLPWIVYPSEKIQYVPVAGDAARALNEKPDGSAHSPFLVEVMPGSDAAQKRADEAQDRQEKRESDAALVAWTRVLAFATIGLIVATGVLGYFGQKQSRDMREYIRAANQANELNRQNFDSVHRPRIRVKHVFLTSEIWAGDHLRAQVVFVNVGISEAKLVQWGIGASVIRNDRSLPARPDYPPPNFALGGVLPSGISLASGSENTGLLFDDAMNVMVHQRTGKLFCHGFVHYRDGMNNLRTTAFCRVLEPPSITNSHTSNWRFVKFDHPDYEYED
jgi:hypothetical protein